MRGLLTSTMRFTHESDAVAVAQMSEGFVSAAAPLVSVMDFHDSALEVAECIQVAQMLPLCTTCTELPVPR